MESIINNEVSTGTTIMAFKVKDGIIIAADGRTSRGSYVERGITDKLTKITDNIFCCRSGSAADTEFIARHVTKEIKLLSTKEESVPSVRKAAHILKNIIYNNRENLLAGMIVAGYDTEPQIYKVNVCGTLTEENIALGGSGSAFIYGFCDINYRDNMSINEGLEFAKKSIQLAIKRDAYSGGIIRVAVIEKNNLQRFIVLGNEVLNI